MVCNSDKICCLIFLQLGVTPPITSQGQSPSGWRLDQSYYSLQQSWKNLTKNIHRRLSKHKRPSQTCCQIKLRLRMVEHSTDLLPSSSTKTTADFDSAIISCMWALNWRSSFPSRTTYKTTTANRDSQKFKKCPKKALLRTSILLKSLLS